MELVISNKATDKKDVVEKTSITDVSSLQMQDEEDHRRKYMNRIRGYEELYDFDYYQERYKYTKILDSDIELFSNMSDKEFYILCKNDSFVDTVYAKLPILKDKVNRHIKKIYRIKVENEFAITLLHKLTLMTYPQLIEIARIINKEWHIAKERITYLDDSIIIGSLKRFIGSFKGITWNRGIERLKVDIMSFFDDPKGYDRTDILLSEIIPLNTENYLLYDINVIYPFWKWKIHSNHNLKYGKLKRNHRTREIDGIYFRGKMIRKIQLVQVIELLTYDENESKYDDNKTSRSNTRMLKDK